MKGYPMGGGNMNNMMKQVQKLQKQMEKMQEEMTTSEFSATVGGAVEAVVNGNKELLKIKIDKDVVDPDDVEMLEDLVLSAVNEAMRTAETKTGAAMKKLTGGLNIPGL